MLRRARTLGERIDDTSLVQVLPELLLLRIWCLQARMQKTALKTLCRSECRPQSWDAASDRRRAIGDERHKTSASRAVLRESRSGNTPEARRTCS